ncbi:MAG: IgGFc-binding protein [Chitinophagaceae bacterium]|nr:IgGFc-binding protein [Chitinophagaceae bacterium]
MKKVLQLITCCLLISSGIFAQNFSNKGKEFYLCCPNHVPSANVLATLSIWITSDRASSGTITMANGAFTANFSIAANGLQQIQVPHSVAHISNAQSGMVIQKSIKVKVNPGQPAVVAYAQLWGQARSAATLLLPTSVLGKKYRAISFTQDGVDGSGQLARSQFQVIATKPNTLVRVTPRLNGVVGPSFDINLPLAGDMYQYQATEDITGTLIESIASGSNGCFPIAVLSGSSNITFGSATCPGRSYDPLFQQLYPITTWGKNFGFIPTADYPNGNALRVMASEDNTTVYFNGVLTATLNAGDIYPNAFISNPTLYTGPANITADKPVCVAQYMPSLDCGGGGYGDPDMVILNPVEQNISDITIFSSSQQNITHQYVNILLKTIAIPSFTINGAAPSGTWQAFAAMPGYSYLKQIFPGSGSYRLKADSGFNAIAYGFGTNYESYAFSAGTNVIDLYQTVGVSMLYGIEPTPSVCTNSPFKFKISLPYMADSIKWDFTSLPGSPPSVTTIYNNPPSPAVPPDSITVVNGKQIYWYSAPALYTFLR